MQAKRKKPPARSQKARDQVKATDSKDSFEAVARRLECDEDKTRFEKALSKIAKSNARESKKGTEK